MINWHFVATCTTAATVQSYKVPCGSIDRDRKTGWLGSMVGGAFEGIEEFLTLEGDFTGHIKHF